MIGYLFGKTCSEVKETARKMSNIYSQ